MPLVQVEVELARLRREAIEAAASDGIAYSTIAERIERSRGRVSQIRSDGPPFERVLFGVNPLDVGFPLRIVSGRRLPMVASEDIEACDLLVELLTDFGFVVERVEIDPRREWKPGAPDLVAICGPKSSPTIAEVLKSDPVLAFTPNADGRWTLKSSKMGREYASPMDDPTPLPSDIAYIGRLKFDRSRPLFLIAGVHGIGSLGAVHYLRSKAQGLYQQVGTSEFSMVVGSEHNDAGDILSTGVVCPPFLH